MDSRSAQYGLLLCLLVAAFYAGLQNPYLTPADDSEIYLTGARNLADGRGYEFNGLPLRHYPPGWPALMAFVMLFSRRFLVLKTMTMLLMLCAALLYYRLLLRLVAPRKAFICVFGAATLWHWFRYTYVLHSESLFFFLLAAALVLTWQVREGRTSWWRLSVLVVLCAALVLTRWLGLLAAGVVAVTAVSGERAPRMNRKWACSGLCLAAALVTFMCLYIVLGDAKAKPSSPQASPATDRRSLTDTVRAANVVHSGLTLPQLFWPVASFSDIDPRLSVAFNAAGITMGAFMLIFALREAKKREWLWVSVVAHALLLGVITPPRERYLAPFAPLLLCSLWGGMDTASDWLAQKHFLFFSAARRYLIGLALGSIFLPNLALYTVESAVQRSSDFYTIFNAGECNDLVNTCHFIAQETPPGSRVALNREYRNLGFVKESNTLAMAMLALLADRPVLSAPDRIGEDGPTEELLQWARQNEVSFFLYRPPTSPWRLWHFRVPSLQRWMTGQQQIPSNPFWILYELKGGQAVKVDLPQVRGWPTQVPRGGSDR